MMYLNDYLSGDILTFIDKYMPDSGESETQASQMCTAINKLIYKYYNDGDIFDNSYYLDGWCNDLSSYANWLYNRNLGKDILIKIRDIHTFKEYEDLLSNLASQLITKENLEELEKKEKEGSIYSESGLFKFIEDKYDEEDDW